ncbi:MAG: hypothetical protein A2015_14780 [Spirochaetes bacterium GWF1_31_7]|nr:MAG: hypothetical protein A2Y30_12040 [Spirochaetes bacterium GWE1_32_154]OHD49413.1 MAG: hypothetical protein A2015_14780 [Spirochaetes bacterium GWF1_31_7]OHD51566.1 MAG: hypothetical protein A2Y29_15400 [Spirochaetes bacterium GWE2_31_10]OHD78203.1 MAG: hypothetical protein A2355_06515 [Spirochaetes bacterium RIFOXYB1_FULL_32_8]HBD93608.1 hypothetical protein [Spirochaetia bacterium]
MLITNMKVLIIVSKDSQLNSLCDLIKNSGCDCEVYNNSIDGLRKYKENSFDIVITDMKMPLVSGLEVVRIIKKINNDTPVLVYGNCDKTAKLCSEHGAERIITKDFTPELILNEIKDLCHSLKK